MAASLAIIALTFVDLPLKRSLEVISIPEDSLYPEELIIVEQSEPLIISGAEMKTLWSTATEIAVEMSKQPAAKAIINSNILACIFHCCRNTSY